MIGYTAADSKYFDLYFALWAGQMNKFYPGMRKIVAVHQPTDAQRALAQQLNVELREAQLPDQPKRPHFYLLRWLNLPWQENDLILETQINCLAVRTQSFDAEQTVDHLRIVRRKPNRVGGICAAVFKPAAAQAVVQHAKSMLPNPPDGDHQINAWMGKKLNCDNSLAEQRFIVKKATIEPWCCWITAGTSQRFTALQKLEILKHYIGYEL